jgi:hypothetical protein
VTVKGSRQAKCKRGHDDWIIDNSGERRCRTCRGMGRRNDGPVARLGNGPREDAFSYSEIMRARGYIV